ncbi:BadM/Rrf2 family transcriptional regulator [Tepidamorphus gemmatus]|jgi:Rrf2 family protein|uniref:BadM/Rrf2 family transcriptional regulator n=1 Tax=Tepidamorphus gemmatus TaxID=747076 RepID=A0A4R3M8G6_9HYPH|nr:Rrf2 family transcriptional regulator [Tepidamorphus gemmatus]TCT09814.1 BadM/Rrf2 family transcriptional regulator [Tepidamorphus gemmatus]
MRLTKQTGYALRILIHCAVAGDRSVTVSEIARAQNITEHNVFKIVPMLVQGGFLETTRGRGGGIRLSRDPAEIRIGDVVRVTEATHIEAECVGGAVECPIRPVAPINRILDEALNAFIDVLDQHTLRDLVAARPKGLGADLLSAVAQTG